MNPARLKAYSLLIMVTIIWGVASPVIKYTLEGFSPLVFLTYRFAISTVVALITFSIVGFKFPKKLSTILTLLFYGFATSTITLGLLFFGLDNTTVLDSSLITLVDPLLIALAGVYFLKEHITKREKVGIAIAILGTILTIVEPLIQGGDGALRLSGNLLIVGYVVTTALSAVMSKKLLRENVSPIILTNISFIIGFLTTAPFTYKEILNSNFELITKIPMNYHLGVFFMALISGSLAYYMANKAQKTIEIGEQAIFGYLYPVFAAPLAVWWLGEKITPIVVLGAIIISIGVFIAETKKR